VIELKPELYKDFICPECSSDDIKVADILFPGIHILADCICNSCGLKFLNDFPIGHSLYYPAVVGKENFKDYSKLSYDWFHKTFLDAYKNQNNQPIKIEKKVLKETKDIIILNCIDYLYGHVLLKLFNAQSYLEQFPSKGLIIIIPKNFEWLIPEGVSEVWLVNIKLSKGREWYNSLNEFIKKELDRFDKIYLSLANSHPDFSEIDISKFTRTKRFSLESFNKKPYTITFINRDDRFWFSSKIGEWLFQMLTKIKLVNFAKIFFSFKQNRKVSEAFKKIKNEIPSVNFYVIGIGKSGTFPSFIQDIREERITKEIEIKWCKIYSVSHLVIGVHGSNMILPTALSAGFIEILPQTRYGNIMQEVGSYYSGPLFLYLCRFVDEYIKPGKIAKIAVSIITGFKNFYLRNSSELNRHKIYKDSSELKKYFDN